jgi:hypothetical protein
MAAGTAGSASAGVFGTYVWRGQQLSDAVVIQPSVSITDGPVSFNLWANYDTDLETLNETDVTISYARSLGTVNLSAGYIYYGLEGLDDTQELYAAVGLSTILAPSLTVYYDFDEGDGFFATLAVGHTVALPAAISLKLGATASYDGGNAVMGSDADGDALNDLYSGEAWASAAIPLGLGVSLEPRVAYSFPLSTDAGDILEGVSPDGESGIFYAGATLSLAF